MKPTTFAAGMLAGAGLFYLINRAVSKNQRSGDDSALKDAEASIEQHRQAIDSLQEQLKERIESETKLAAQCEALTKADAEHCKEIESLKDVCVKQDIQNKKLEAEVQALQGAK